MEFIKVTKNPEMEAELQRIAHTHGFSPAVLAVNETSITMEHVDGCLLADLYGENPAELPKWYWEQIRYMVRTLYEFEGIEYRDITPYNFIDTEDGLRMIDFGDAKYTDGEPDWFVREFLDGENSWNPDYK